jgi:hypothetical protein
MTAKATVAAPGQLQGGEMVTFKQRAGLDISGRAGTVAGGPRFWLRAEGATLLIGSLVAYSYTGQPWWLIPLALLVPDLSMAGYLWGTRLGARVYNIAHCMPLPAILVAFGWWQYKPLVLALGLVWFAHIGLDSLLGYGLKYDDDFQHTHLGWIGRDER